MNQPEGFEWKGVRFGWSWHRAALKGNIQLSDKTYWLMVREVLPDKWESWIEFEGGYTIACSMASRDLALEGATLALKDYFETSLKELEAFTP